ncbi:hypothetical protein [Peribacillus phoenicis]|uniref:hypothetical protein n=1 Tax=unclassified Peribacillus TaxID=2675266 RepID=UPI0039A26437
MTLITGVRFDNYVIVSCDSSYQLVYYDMETGEEIDTHFSKLDETKSKVKKLTNKVLYGMGGTEQGHELILDRVADKLQPNDDINKCRQVIWEVVQELTESDYYFKSILEQDSIGGNLVGFNRDGTSSQYVMMIGKETPNSFENLPDNFSMLNPYGFKEYISGHVFGLGNPHGKMDFKTISKTVQLVHGTLSYVNPNYVSSDCTLYIIKKRKKKGEYQYQFEKTTVDTSYYQTQLPSQKEVEAWLYQRM